MIFPPYSFRVKNVRKFFHSGGPRLWPYILYPRDRIFLFLFFWLFCLLEILWYMYSGVRTCQRFIVTNVVYRFQNVSSLKRYISNFYFKLKTKLKDYLFFYLILGRWTNKLKKNNNNKNNIDIFIYFFFVYCFDNIFIQFFSHFIYNW